MKDDSSKQPECQRGGKTECLVEVANLSLLGEPNLGLDAMSLLGVFSLGLPSSTRFPGASLRLPRDYGPPVFLELESGLLLTSRG